MSKLCRARSLLYRRQNLQENIRWKALDEIYKIYMLLHRSDLNISENFRQTSANCGNINFSQIDQIDAQGQDHFFPNRPSTRKTEINFSQIHAKNRNYFFPNRPDPCEKNGIRFFPPKSTK